MTELRINENKKICEMSPLLYGIFFEDINYGGDGGLYGELIANRAFEYYDRDGKKDLHKMRWEPKDRITVTDSCPLNESQRYSAVISGAVRNMGFCGEGFSTRAGEVFRFMVYAASDKHAELSARIVNGNGEEVAPAKIDIDGAEWKKYELELTSCADCKNAYIELEPHGCDIRIAFTSLFSTDTYKGRKNGMRRDLAELLAALKPSFMRFPGGCIVEGRSFDNMYNWKDTVGAIEERRTNWNRWQMEEYQQEGRDSSDYFQSYGIGFYEYFVFCEDIGAKPVPVINCGMTCQWHEGLLVDMGELDKWIKDVEDLIEFANGNIDTKWGGIRASMGHPEPFGLKYIGIGNEQWGNEYFERYEVFADKLMKKYPDIKLITSAGWKDRGWEFDLAMDWMSRNKEKAYAVDEHFYKEPEWFLNNISRYDGYDRSLPKVFIGEYAAHSDSDIKARRCNWECALAEAAFLTGVEKNSGHVIMSCYAPLFGRADHQQWQPDLIWFDTDRSYATPSYYVQKLFSENAGGTVVETAISDDGIKVTSNVMPDGTLIIKAVNITGDAAEIDIKTEKTYDNISIEEIAADPKDENSFDEPYKVRPRFVKADGGAVTIKPYSVNIIRMENK